MQLVLSTRGVNRFSESLAGVIEFGASPRATISLDRCARARAWLLGRDYVAPEDVQSMVHNCLRHRIILTMQGQSQGWHNDSVIDELLSLVPAV